MVPFCFCTAFISKTPVIWIFNFKQCRVYFIKKAYLTGFKCINYFL